MKEFRTSGQTRTSGYFRVTESHGLTNRRESRGERTSAGCALAGGQLTKQSRLSEEDGCEPASSSGPSPAVC